MQPTPFESVDVSHVGLNVEHPEPSTSEKSNFETIEAEGIKLLTNGKIRLMVLDEGGRVFRRRGISGFAKKPIGETMISHLNTLAGELLSNLEMTSEEIAEKLNALLVLARPIEIKRSEWAVAELDGVRVYTDGESIVMTKRNLTL